jgi:hypothetical protein
MSNLQTITRELINKFITPEQERAWMSYWAQRPEQAAEGQARLVAGKAMAEELLAAMRQGRPPDAPEVQTLVKRLHDNWTKHGMRERQLEQYTWNPEVTRAWSVLGGKLLARAASPADPAEAEKLQAYILEARRQSPAARAFRPLAEQAAKLRAANTPLTSPEARALAKRYAAVCEEHDLGDAAVHARWIVAFADFDEATRAKYAFLAKIVAA